MARSARKRVPNAGAPAYKTTFQGHPAVLIRLDDIMLGKPDPLPGSTNSSFLEDSITALAAGVRAPITLESLNGQVEWALRELFLLRDAKMQLERRA